MTPVFFARELARARREGRRVPSGVVPVVTDVRDAYRIQSELAALEHGDVRGWKVTALTPADRANFRSSHPVAGALLGSHVHPAPATLTLSNFVAPLLECEVAFVLGDDLPERERAYERGEIGGAIARAVAVFEIPDSRLAPDAPNILKLADCMSNGALVVGTPVDVGDVTNIEIVLRHEGVILERGSSARVLGDPLLAVGAIANAQPLPAGGLRKGQIVTTGTCTDPVELRKGRYVAEFGPLGSLGMTVV
jgi:2-keto-4-pentenoate hydratase